MEYEIGSMADLEEEEEEEESESEAEEESEIEFDEDGVPSVEPSLTSASGLSARMHPRVTSSPARPHVAAARYDGCFPAKHLKCAPD